LSGSTSQRRCRFLTISSVASSPRHGRTTG